MADAVSQVNQKILSSITSINWGRTVGWILFILVICGGGIWAYIYQKNKKVFNKGIVAFDSVGEYFEPSIRDRAKVVKLGKGGFEILYLQKQKTWKIAYGGKTGKSDYYFFILPDGYWHNGKLSAKVSYLDKEGGLVSVVTTNPLMRSQYTSLEKQIDSLTGQKAGFWDKYGGWVMSIAFVLIAGVLMWLIFREFSTAMGSLTSMNDKMAQLLDKVITISDNMGTATTNGGLIKA